MGVRPSHNASLSTAVLVFDGHCGFCRFWVDRWRHTTAGSVEFRPYQSLDPSEFPEVTRDRFAQAVHYFEPEGRASDGALAVARLAAWTSGSRGRHWVGQTLTALYERLPGAANAAEYAYRVVADHRNVCMRATTLLWGQVSAPSEYARTAWLFRRLLGVVYALAFLSLSGQIVGLIGEHGILPVRWYLQDVAAVAGGGSWGERMRLLPTLCWFAASDAFLRALCYAGASLGLLLALGAAPIVILPALWVTYLSLVSAGGDFTAFQWDGLLLEAGLFAVCLAPPVRWDRWATAPEPPRTAVWIFRWLLFRLMFGAGVIKLASGDPSWRNLTAVAFHYGTQPLPTPLAWYAAQLPMGVHRLCTAAALAIQLGAPWLLFAPRRLRAMAGVLLGVLELLIGAAGNYGFFNILSVALCLFAFDDATFAPLRAGQVSDASRQPGRWHRAAVAAVFVLSLPLTMRGLAGSFLIDLEAWPIVSTVAVWSAPFRSMNTYGLFATMTTTRPEIVIEGSEDGLDWRAYEFRYKAGALDRRPPWVAPHQPRLDWQMWFAALSTYESERWFQALCERLLDGSPDVLGLFARDPFAGRPPRYLRATRYLYRFSTWRGGKADAAWWVRVPVGPYMPVLERGARERLARTWVDRNDRAWYGTDIPTIMMRSSER